MLSRLQPEAHPGKEGGSTAPERELSLSIGAGVFAFDKYFVHCSLKRISNGFPVWNRCVSAWGFSVRHFGKTHRLSSSVATLQARNEVQIDLVNCICCFFACSNCCWRCFRSRKRVSFFSTSSSWMRVNACTCLSKSTKAYFFRCLDRCAAIRLFSSLCIVGNIGHWIVKRIVKRQTLHWKTTTTTTTTKNQNGYNLHAKLHLRRKANKKTRKTVKKIRQFKNAQKQKKSIEPKRQDAWQKKAGKMQRNVANARNLPDFFLGDIALIQTRRIALHSLCESEAKYAMTQASIVLSPGPANAAKRVMTTERTLGVGYE